MSDLQRVLNQCLYFNLTISYVPSFQYFFGNGIFVSKELDQCSLWFLHECIGVVPSRTKPGSSPWNGPQLSGDFVGLFVASFEKKVYVRMEGSEHNLLDRN
jgi:hypothetical protein